MMSKQTEALKMAIEALERAAEYLAGDDKYDVYNLDKAYFACKEALAQKKPHEIREHVNRLTKIGKEFGQTQQCRDRISREVLEFHECEEQPINEFNPDYDATLEIVLENKELYKINEELNNVINNLEVTIHKLAQQPAQEPEAYLSADKKAAITRIMRSIRTEDEMDGKVIKDFPTPLYTHPAPSQWISIKDKFPEFVDISDFEKSSSDVLILIDGKHIYIGSYIWDSYSQETEFCMRDLDGGYEGVGDMNVTHWMPLPESPKEKNHG